MDRGRNINDENNEFYNEYQQILNFDNNFDADDLEEEKIVQDLSN